MKRKIIVHNPCNEHTRYYRNYNLFWDKLTEDLKKYFNVTENRFYEFANSNMFDVKLKKGKSPFFALHECEYVIEFEDTGDFYILSVSDRLSAAMLNERNNPHLKKVLVSQFNYDYLKSHVGDSISKYIPWIYFPQEVFNYDEYYQKRKNIDTFIDKMYFRGTLSERPITQYFNKNYVEGFIPIKNYFDDLIKYKLGLSIAGVGELCYRDIEYMCIGIPFIRFEYLSELNPKLIPNYHYISVNRPNDIPSHNGLSTDRLGLDKHAKMIEKRFLEVKNDKDFLNYISNNARNYYETYLNQNNINHTLNLLSII
jgi:hypothetical protein